MQTQNAATVQGTFKDVEVAVLPLDQVVYGKDLYSVSAVWNSLKSWMTLMFL